MTEFKFTKAQEDWLAALESGDYKQCFGTAEEAGGLCALSVALKLHRAKDPCAQGLVESLLDMKRVGLVRVVRLNDGKRLSFPEIAARIRREPTRFFTRGAE